MQYHKVVTCFAAVAISGFIYDVSALTGKVLDYYSNPVGGAYVHLMEQNVSDTTKSDGSFVFSTTAAMRATSASASRPITVSRGAVALRLAGQSSVALDLFDTRGRCVSDLFCGTLPGGDHSFTIAQEHGATQVLFLRAVINGKSSVFPLVCGTGSSMQAAIPQAGHGAGAMTKRTADTLDVIEVTCSGYQLTIVPLYGGEQQITIRIPGNIGLSFVYIGGAPIPVVKYAKIDDTNALFAQSMTATFGDTVWVPGQNNSSHHLNVTTYGVSQFKTGQGSVDVHVPADRGIVAPVIISLIPQPGTAQAVADLRITDQVFPWQELGGSYWTDPADSLWEIFDGGADTYVNGGLVDWIHQIVETSPDSTRQASLFVGNYGTESKATAEYGSLKTGSSYLIPVEIPGFDSSVAIAEVIGGGIKVMAHFNKFYLEFYLQYYAATDTDTALADAALLLSWYRMRITGQ